MLHCSAAILLLSLSCLSLSLSVAVGSLANRCPGFLLYHIVLMLFLCPPFSAFVIPHSVGLILQDYLLSAPVLIMCFMSYHGHVMSFLYSLVRFLVRLGRGVICIAYTQAMTVADRPSLGGWAGAALVAGYLPPTYTHTLDVPSLLDMTDALLLPTTIHLLLTGLDCCRFDVTHTISQDLLGYILSEVVPDNLIVMNTITTTTTTTTTYHKCLHPSIHPP
ncbi:hypothetical protein An07g08510 [Aspergillus niger]|uniref:Uncharacterized protein n=2 Tax=Aspergillus niger TaxID=5061 RepID=A2QP80_ASPNC|nr:hypothetical protein An07g08510 [Aspergillus niger]CAK39645.1 hypothetical protein An07g08510 [Aspergillus niger]